MTRVQGQEHKQLLGPRREAPPVLELHVEAPRELLLYLLVEVVVRQAPQHANSRREAPYPPEVQCPVGSVTVLDQGLELYRDPPDGLRCGKLGKSIQVIRMRDLKC